MNCGISTIHNANPNQLGALEKSHLDCTQFYLSISPLLTMPLLPLVQATPMPKQHPVLLPSTFAPWFWWSMFYFMSVLWDTLKMSCMMATIGVREASPFMGRSFCPLVFGMLCDVLVNKSGRYPGP